MLVKSENKSYAKTFSQSNIH